MTLPMHPAYREALRKEAIRIAQQPPAVAMMHLRAHSPRRPSAAIDAAFRDWLSIRPEGDSTVIAIWGASDLDHSLT